MLPRPPTRGPVITPMSGWASRSSRSLLVLAKYNMGTGGADPLCGPATPGGPQGNGAAMAATSLGHT
ncbi:hypothetical protein GCM10008960_32430 [Deinococcus sedimenti]|uniref:Uncharacterized protein n=1 Tax=Deinococcus sedimenti TaxID=1867090 RepID=A0ABQ2S7V6_9DEIO|nr:hypothetical protein GCM10008960_32430 [Deinococcus sedimenti]